MKASPVIEQPIANNGSAAAATGLRLVSVPLGARRPKCARAPDKRSSSAAPIRAISASVPSAVWPCRRPLEGETGYFSINSQDTRPFFCFFFPSFPGLVEGPYLRWVPNRTSGKNLEMISSRFGVRADARSRMTWKVFSPLSLRRLLPRSIRFSQKFLAQVFDLAPFCPGFPGHRHFSVSLRTSFGHCKPPRCCRQNAS